jgi:hypothetical protein
MPYEELLALLNRARTVLDHYMFDLDETIRDDVAEVCMAIDDALPEARQAASGRNEPIPRIYAVRGITR